MTRGGRERFIKAPFRRTSPGEKGSCQPAHIHHTWAPCQGAQRADRAGCQRRHWASFFRLWFWQCFFFLCSDQAPGTKKGNKSPSHHRSSDGSRGAVEEGADAVRVDDGDGELGRPQYAAHEAAPVAVHHLRVLHCAARHVELLRLAPSDVPPKPTISSQLPHTTHIPHTPHTHAHAHTARNTSPGGKGK